MRVAIGVGDSVLLAGRAEGTWNGTSAGGNDFVAVKLSADGTELWRWQVLYDEALPSLQYKVCPYRVATQDLEALYADRVSPEMNLTFVNNSTIA